jgi:hypothetical protein
VGLTDPGLVAFGLEQLERVARCRMGFLFSAQGREGEPELELGDSLEECHVRAISMLDGFARPALGCVQPVIKAREARAANGNDNHGEMVLWCD